MDPRRLQNPRIAAREAKRLWEQSLEIWEDFQERGLDYARDEVHGPALLDLLGDVRGLRVLDVGCGQGRFTRQLAGVGASVTAVDWSPGMLRLARRHERSQPLGIRYRRMDARSIGRAWRPGAFERVVGCMSFMDMPGLDRVLRGAHRILTDEGRLVFSVSHPMNTAEVRWERPAERDRGAMGIRRYFVRRVGVTEWRMQRLKGPFDTIYWHRTLEDWYRLLRRSGFEVERLTEPRATAASARSNKYLRGALEFPFFLVLSCRRVPRTGTDTGVRAHRRRPTFARPV